MCVCVCVCVCVFIFILVLSPSPNEGNEIREMQVKCKANCAEGNQMDALLFFVLHIKKNKKKIVPICKTIAMTVVLALSKLGILACLLWVCTSGVIAQMCMNGK